MPLPYLPEESFCDSPLAPVRCLNSCTRTHAGILPSMTVELQTGRLILRPLQLEDAEQVQQLFPQWEIVKHLNNRIPWPFPADGVINHYRTSALPAIERGEEWHWTLRLKTSPETIIGAIGLMQGNNNRGFWLVPEMHRKGL